MTDPRRRLRRLDDVPTRDLWSRIEGRAADEAEPLEVLTRQTSFGRRLATIGLAFAVFAAGGVFLVTRFDRGEPAPPPADDPLVPGNVADELRITCTDEGTVVEDDVVALQADGVHIAFRNESDANFIAIRNPDRRIASMGFDLGSDSDTVLWSSPDTGTWMAACTSVPEGALDLSGLPERAYSPPFEVVDPQGYLDDIRDAAGCGEHLPQPVPTAGTDAPLAAPLSGRLTVHAWNHHTGEGRAFFVDADGSDLEAVDVPPDRFDELELSPDGSRIALVIHDSDGDPTVTYAALEDGEVYVMNRDGSGLTRLTDNDASDDILHWAPGGRLSFRSNRDRNLSLYVMDADGSNVRPLLDLDVADAHDWAPDGSRLAVVGSDGVDRGDGCRGNGHELYVANPDGSGLTVLTEDELYQQAPAWSPDGSTIAFTASDQSDYAWEIFLVNADGSGLRRITDYPGYDQDPIWSPDGTLIAFTSDRFRGPDLRGESQGGLPYVMNADGSGVRPLLVPGDLGLDREWEIFVTDWRA
jgi:WD40 repeat protein